MDDGFLFFFLLFSSGLRAKYRKEKEREREKGGEKVVFVGGC